jgi:hypothetical protein
MKRPSFQFYPADWRNNAKLRRCSWEARGAWLEVMCLIHDSEEYGLLRWPLKEIAQAIGAPIKLLNELVAKGVLKGGDKGHDALIYTPRSGRKDGAPVTLICSGHDSLWFSSRMVIDEYKRQNSGGSTKFKSKSDAPSHWQGDALGDAPSQSPYPHQSDGSTPTSKDLKHTTENLTAGNVCSILRSKGISSVNPSNPKLQTLLAANVPLSEFEYAAGVAIERGKGFAYAIGIVEGRLAEANNPSAGKGRAHKFDAVAYVNQGRKADHDVIDAE